MPTEVVVQHFARYFYVGRVSGKIIPQLVLRASPVNEFEHLFLSASLWTLVVSPLKVKGLLACWCAGNFIGVVSLERQNLALHQSSVRID